MSTQKTLTIPLLQLWRNDIDFVKYSYNPTKTLANSDNIAAAIAALGSTETIGAKSTDDSFAFIAGKASPQVNGYVMCGVQSGTNTHTVNFVDASGTIKTDDYAFSEDAHTLPKLATFDGTVTNAMRDLLSYIMFDITIAVNTFSFGRVFCIDFNWENISINFEKTNANAEQILDRVYTNTPGSTYMYVSPGEPFEYETGPKIILGKPGGAQYVSPLSMITYDLGAHIKHDILHLTGAIIHEEPMSVGTQPFFAYNPGTSWAYTSMSFDLHRLSDLIFVDVPVTTINTPDPELSLAAMLQTQGSFSGYSYDSTKTMANAAKIQTAFNNIKGIYDTFWGYAIAGTDNIDYRRIGLVCSTARPARVGVHILDIDDYSQNNATWEQAVIHTFVDDNNLPCDHDFAFDANFGRAFTGPNIVYPPKKAFYELLSLILVKVAPLPPLAPIPNPPAGCKTLYDLWDVQTIWAGAQYMYTLTKENKEMIETAVKYMWEGHAFDCVLKHSGATSEGDFSLVFDKDQGELVLAFSHLSVAEVSPFIATIIDATGVLTDYATSNPYIAGSWIYRLDDPQVGNMKSNPYMAYIAKLIYFKMPERPAWIDSTPTWAIKDEASGRQQDKPYWDWTKPVPNTSEDDDNS
jgi:hypothetical protein